MFNPKNLNSSGLLRRQGRVHGLKEKASMQQMAQTNDGASGRGVTEAEPSTWNDGLLFNEMKSSLLTLNVAVNVYWSVSRAHGGNLESVIHSKNSVNHYFARLLRAAFGNTNS